jgi:hypothetical protein
MSCSGIAMRGWHRRRRRRNPSAVYHWRLLIRWHSNDVSVAPLSNNLGAAEEDSMRPVFLPSLRQTAAAPELYGRREGRATE